MDIDLLERNFAHEVLTHHNHAGNPEEENIKGGDQYVGRIECFQILGFARPAHG